MSYPPPPPGSPTPGKKPRLRGHTGFRVGGILAIVGLALAIVGGVIVGTQSLGKVDDFQRVSFGEPGATTSATIHFGSSGGYLAYYEAPDLSDSTKIYPAFQLTMSMVGSSTPVSLTTYGNRSDGKVDSLTYDNDNHHGAAIYQYHIDSAGDYKVTLLAGPDVDAGADMAFGGSIATGTVLGGSLAAIGVLLLIAGIIVLIVALVRRRNHKNQLLATGGYGSSPPGAYPPPGYYGQHPGYSQPQYGQPQYGQPNPQYGQQNPQYGQQNPQYGQQNPSGYQGNPPPAPSEEWQRPTSLRKNDSAAEPEQRPWPPQD